MANIRFVRYSENPNRKTLDRNVITFPVVTIKPRRQHSQKNFVFLKIEKKKKKTICTVCGRNGYKRNLWSGPALGWSVSATVSSLGNSGETTNPLCTRDASMGKMESKKVTSC